MKISFKKKSSKTELKYKYDIRFSDFKELSNGTLIFPIVDDRNPDYANVVGYGIIPYDRKWSESIIGHFAEFTEEEEQYLIHKLHAFSSAK